MTGALALTTLRAFTEPRRRPGLVRPSEAEHLIFPFEGQQLTVWRWGSSGSQASRRVLLVHGWEDDSALWTSWVEAYRARGAEVLSLDLPAHGHSTGNVTTPVQSGRAVAHVAAHLGPVHQAIGHSMGSAALLAAFWLGLQVEQSVHIAGPSVLTHMVQGAARSARLSEADTDRFLTEFERLIGGPTTDWDIGALRSGLRHPGLIAYDPADRRVPASESALLHAHWPQSTLLPLEGTGHRRIVESTLLLQAALERFASST